MMPGQEANGDNLGNYFFDPPDNISMLIALIKIALMGRF